MERVVVNEIIELCFENVSEFVNELTAKPYEIMGLADELRKKCCGDKVTFVVNRNINFTDICINNCKFCSFRYNKGFILSLDEVKNKVVEALDYGCTEVCIQGGLFPNADVNFYVSLLEAVREVSDKVHIHAFSPMEVVHASRNSNMGVGEVLREFKHAGLDSMPGTAAEILNDSVRKKICPGKIDTSTWTRVVKTAHKMGIPTTATMMYGHIESWEDRIKHILLIRKIQEETGGFTEFIPLTFLWRNNELGKFAKGCSGFEDLLVVAVSRILLYPVIKNIQASWVKYGIKLAQAALFAGANDLGGTLMEENISKAAGSVSGEFMSVEEFVEVIKRCNRVPVERDTLYNVLRIFC